jgi:hypothetical protein
VETDPTRALAWLIGLPVHFLGGEDGPDGEARIYVQSVRAHGGCPSCGSFGGPQTPLTSEAPVSASPNRPHRRVWP